MFLGIDISLKCKNLSFEKGLDFAGKGFWFDPAHSFQDAAGTTPSSAGDPVGRTLDRSGNGNHASQATNDDYRPTYGGVTPQGGAYWSFDGVDDRLTFALPSDVKNTNNMHVLMAVETTDNSFALIARGDIDPPPGQFWIFGNNDPGAAPGSGPAGSPSYFVDDVQHATRQSFRNAMNAPGFHLVEARNLNSTSSEWSVLQISGQGSQHVLNGNIGQIMAFDANVVSASTINSAKQDLAAKYGVALP